MTPLKFIYPATSHEVETGIDVDDDSFAALDDETSLSWPTARMTTVCLGAILARRHGSGVRVKGAVPAAASAAREGEWRSTQFVVPPHDFSPLDVSNNLSPRFRSAATAARSGDHRIHCNTGADTR